MCSSSSLRSSASMNGLRDGESNGAYAYAGAAVESLAAGLGGSSSGRCIMLNSNFSHAVSMSPMSDAISDDTAAAAAALSAVLLGSPLAFFRCGPGRRVGAEVGAGEVLGVALGAAVVVDDDAGAVGFGCVAVVVDFRVGFNLARCVFGFAAAASATFSAARCATAAAQIAAFCSAVFDLRQPTGRPA